MSNKLTLNQKSKANQTAEEKRYSWNQFCCDSGILGIVKQKTDKNNNPIESTIVDVEVLEVILDGMKKNQSEILILTKRTQKMGKGQKEVLNFFSPLPETETEKATRLATKAAETSAA